MKKLLQIALITLIVISSTTQAADEGIKVHGHWTFNIYNADGSFDRKVDFENSLADSSPLLRLLNLNNDNTVITQKMISLVGSSASTQPCISIPASNGNPEVRFECRITDGNNAAGNLYEFTNLTSGLDNGTTPTLFRFQGSMTAATGTPDISGVSTFLFMCSNPTTAPQPISGSIACNGSGDVEYQYQFTSKTLASPVTLQPGQVVQVTVEISFS